jgi:hypothetical protein
MKNYFLKKKSGNIILVVVSIDKDLNKWNEMVIENKWDNNIYILNISIMIM